MTQNTAPCDDCGRDVPVPDDWPLDYAYCRRSDCISSGDYFSAPLINGQEARP